MSVPIVSLPSGHTSTYCRRLLLDNLAGRAYFTVRSRTCEVRGRSQLVSDDGMGVPQGLDESRLTEGVSRCRTRPAATKNTSGASKTRAVLVTAGADRCSGHSILASTSGHGDA